MQGFAANQDGVWARPKCDDRLELRALPGLPIVAQGDDVVTLISAGLGRAGIALQDGDVLGVTSKILSRAEGRFVDLRTVDPSPRAQAIGTAIGKDPRIVELILRESIAISRQAPGSLIVRHRLGFITANASIDCSKLKRCCVILRCRSSLSRLNSATVLRRPSRPHSGN